MLVCVSIYVGVLVCGETPLNFSKGPQKSGSRTGVWVLMHGMQVGRPLWEKSSEARLHACAQLWDPLLFPAALGRPE